MHSRLMLVLITLVLAGCASPPAATQDTPREDATAPEEPSGSEAQQSTTPTDETDDAPSPTPASTNTEDTDADAPPSANSSADPPETPPTQEASSPANATNAPPADEPGTPPSDEQTPGAPTGFLRVHYVDVGQGDGTIWEFPDGTLVVYDCGDAAGSADTNPMVTYLRALGKPAGATIHALIASHGHLDHIGGCEEILQEYRIDHLYEAWYDGADAPQSYGRFRQQLMDEGGTIHTLRETPALSGEQMIRQWDLLDLPGSTSARAQLVFPDEFGTQDWDAIAEASLVVRLTYGDTHFCFQGDIETSQENTLASYERDLSCQAYLVGHHGSKYASSSSWLAKMQPRHAVVSFGPNSYGHPTPEALCRTQTAGADVYATHRHGTIVLESDGMTISSSAAPETIDYCTPGASYWPTTTQTETSPTTTNPPPTPPAEESPPAAPTTSLSVVASPNTATPCRYTTVTITVTVLNEHGAPVAGADVSSDWHYKTTTSHESGATDSSGVARLSRGISGASAGYTVTVDVTASYGSITGTATTSFTPRSC